MSASSDFTLRVFKAFAIPGLLGALYYCFATFSARFFSPTPLYRYLGRVGFMLLAVVLWWVLFVPWYWDFILPRGTLNFEHPPEELGATYGLHTIWIWCAAALVSWRKGMLHGSQTA